MPFVEVSDVTSDAFTISTYVYNIFEINGAPVAYYPCEPSQVRYAYSVLGIENVNHPSVTVSHPNGGEYFRSEQTIPITWDVEDEYTEGVRCGISINYDGGCGTWTSIASDITVDSGGHGEYAYIVSSGIPRTESHCRIRVIANDSNQHQGLDMSDADFTIEYLTKQTGEPIPGQGAHIAHDAPGEHFLDRPAPNPCNPRTTLRFGVKEPARVSLVIYDVHGKVIRTFYRDAIFMPGEYSEIWSAQNDHGFTVGTGLYFLRFDAGNVHEIKKLIVLR